MSRKLKRALKWLRPGRAGDLDYIHIGKCGGKTLWAAIRHSDKVRARFTRIRRTHTEQPTYKARAGYIIVLRNPVDRALSAFNWRQKLVIDDGAQPDRYPGEAEVLRRYPTLEALAQALYPDGSPDPQAIAAFRKIHHLREDIAFYLDPLLPRLRSDQVFAVLCQETLDADMERYLGVHPAERVHEHRSHTDPARLTLSDTARANLARVLEGDYRAIAALDRISPLGEARMAHLMRR